MVEEANNEQASNATSAEEKSQQPSEAKTFITLPFDEEISFQSSLETLNWVKEDKKRFEYFFNCNLSYKNNSKEQKDVIEFPDDIRGMNNRYVRWYEQAIEILEDIFKLQSYSQTITTPVVLEEKKDDLIRYWTEFTNYGLVPMQSNIGRCAIAMGKIQHNITQKQPFQYEDVPQQGITWLHAMTQLRKQYAEQHPKLANIKAKIAEDTALLESLEGAIKKGQDKIKQYEEDIEAFRNNGLKEAALQLPAVALSDLEKVHKDAAKRYFYITAGVVGTWIFISMTVYYHFLVRPIIGKVTEVPLETGAVAITGMVFTGIVLTSIIIFLRLGVSRINFSIAAGERKAMAAAYRALLNENALPNDQQMLFLQNIVGSKLPDFVSTSDIRMPAEELTKLVQAVSKDK